MAVWMQASEVHRMTFFEIDYIERRHCDDASLKF